MYGLAESQKLKAKVKKYHPDIPPNLLVKRLYNI